MGTKDLHLEDRYVRRETESEGVGNKSPGVLLSCFMTLLALVVILLPVCILNRRRSRRRRIQDSEALARTLDTGVESERRYYAIESWLVNKQVLAHDEVCDLAMQCSTSLNENKSTMSITDSSPYLDTCDSEAEDESLDEGDATKHECPICFDRFLVGEIVSWSPNPRCDHVFHHHCIKEWLQKRKDCPFCREMFLPVDKVSAEITISDIPELILGQERRKVPCFYCLKHRVITVPKATQLDQQTDVSDSVRSVLLERSTALPERAVLTSLRGRCPRSSDALSTDTTMPCSGDECNPQLLETCQLEGNADPVLMSIEHSTSQENVRNRELVSAATDIASVAFDTASSNETAKIGES